jgi:hypothetical protein
VKGEEEEEKEEEEEEEEKTLGDTDGCSSGLGELSEGSKTGTFVFDFLWNISNK